MDFLYTDALLTIFLYTITGLLFGFVFQATTKFIREHGWNEKTMKEVAYQKHNEKIFENCYKHIYSYKGNIEKSLMECRLKQTFYLMDNALSRVHPLFLRTLFSSRFAFWSNMFFMLSILCCFKLIRLISLPMINIEDVMLVIFIAISWWSANQYFYAFYDSILKSYYMLIVKKTKLANN